MGIYSRLGIRKKSGGAIFRKMPNAMNEGFKTCIPLGKQGPKHAFRYQTLVSRMRFAK